MSLTALPNVSGLSDTPFSFDVSGLTPNTTYYFRVVATNVVGTTNSAELSFRTAAQVVDFNIYTFGNLTLGSGSVKGRVAAGGNASLSSMSIGNGLSGTSDVLIVGGDLNASGGSVLRGNVVYSGTATLSSLSIPQGTARKVADPLSASTEAWAKSVSATWVSLCLPPNPSCDVSIAGTTLTFIGTDPVRNVFSVSGANLAKAKNIIVSAPQGSTVVINVSGTAGTIANTGMSVSGTDSQHVVFNFYEATTLTVGSVAVQGMIWAPAADVTVSGGSIEATLLAKSLQASSVSFNGSSFLGTLP
jgi:choice-of-anchor A domain-containing protein